MKSNRVVVYLAVLFLPSLGLYVAIGRLSNLNADAVTFVWLYAALFVLYVLAAVPVLRTNQASRGILTFIIGAAIVFRLVAAFSAPFLSTDVYRYAWEGRVQKAGFAPYKYAPSDKALAKLRAEGGYLEIRDSKNSRSVYPPVAQAFFYAAAFTGKYNVAAIKTLLALLDIATIFLLLGLTRNLKRADSLIILYAWSPLAVIEISGTGHIDGLAVFFLTAAAYLAISKRSFFAGGLGGLAGATKLYPIVALPAFANRRDWRLLTGAVLFGALAYLPFLISGEIFLPIGTEAATSGPKFNAGLKTVVEWICGGPGPGVDTAYTLLTLAVLAAACVYFWLKEKRPQDMIRAAYILLGMLIVFLPFTVPWYLVLVLPFAALEAAPAFLYLSGAVMTSYLFYAYQPWSLPGWVGALEFVPFALLIGWETLKLRNPVNRSRFIV